MVISRWARVPLALVLALLAVATSAAAQRRPAAAAPVRAATAADSAARVDSAAAPARWYAPVASLVVPGLGQALLGEERAIGYVVTELYAWLEYRAWRTEGRRRRGEYQRLAAEVARAGFSADGPVGPFSYYETMRNFVASGAFDRVPGGALDPEIDESTFNGQLWRLARETFWADPAVTPPEESAAYRNAQSLYIQRAILPEYAWSWRDAALEFDLYRLTIARSNVAFRRAQSFAGVLIANHLLSMVDAIAVVRVRLPDGGPSQGVAVEASVPWPRAR
jgi:hypothetical protein